MGPDVLARFRSPEAPEGKRKADASSESMGAASHDELKGTQRDTMMMMKKGNLGFNANVSEKRNRRNDTIENTWKRTKNHQVTMLQMDVDEEDLLESGVKSRPHSLCSGPPVRLVLHPGIEPGSGS